MAVGLPTSTAAFHMAAMYGVRPDIPGFHYYDRERRGDIHFPRRGHAAAVEAKQAAGRRGILHGGSAYGCVFTGGADNNLFTFSSLTRPRAPACSPRSRPSWWRLGLFEELGELPSSWSEPLRGSSRTRTRGGAALAHDQDRHLGMDARLFHDGGGPRSLRRGARGLRQLRRLRRGGALLRSRQSSGHVTLRRVDRAIRQLWRVVRRVPEHQYDLYILSDHGQAPCKPYRDVNGGQRFEQWIFDQFLSNKPTPAAAERSQFSLAHGMHSRSRGPRDCSSNSSTTSTPTFSGAAIRKPTSKTASA